MPAVAAMESWQKEPSARLFLLFTEGTYTVWSFLCSGGRQKHFCGILTAYPLAMCSVMYISRYTEGSNPIYQN